MPIDASDWTPAELSFEYEGGSWPIRCPNCGLDSVGGRERANRYGARWRNYKCWECGHRWTDVLKFSIRIA